MKKNKILLLVIHSLSIFCYSQNSSSNEYQYELFDSIIKQKNLHIDKGEVYYEKYGTINNNHHYLFENKFIKGDLKYNNQMYYNVLMKYDIYEDNLILKIDSETIMFPIILNKELISFFKIKNKTFHNFNLGFYEVIYKSKNETLVKKYFSKRETLKKIVVYYNFTQNEKLLILKSNKFYTVKRKKHFYEVFPTKKKKINDFFKTNRRKNKDASFITNLLKKLNGE